MNVVKVLKYGHDDYIIVEDTQNTMDWQYRARQRDGGGSGCGHTPREAILSLTKGLRAEADRIEQALNTV